MHLFVEYGILWFSLYNSAVVGLFYDEA